MEYKGQIEGFPQEIVDKMLYEQEKQGNYRDLSVFERHASVAAHGGGFNWDCTIDGDRFWNNVIGERKFHLFFEKYPKDSVNNNYEIF